MKYDVRDETPLFTVSFWKGISRIIQLTVLGGFFFGFSLLSFYEAFAVLSPRGQFQIPDIEFIALGAGCLGAFLVMLVSVFIFSSKYEFFDTGFKRSYRGKTKEFFNYRQIDNCRLLRFGKGFEKAIFLNGRDEVGMERTLAVVRGNPRNKKLGLNLYDFLQAKISSHDV
jgi:hypothetical protein